MGNSILIGIISSILTVVILTLISNIKTYLRLKRFNGQYLGYQMNGSKIEAPVFFFLFSFWNIFKVQGTIKMWEVIDNKQTWTNKLYVNNSSPTICFGVFNYLNSVSWGRHQIEMSEDKFEIFVTAISRRTNNEISYKLQKMNKPLQLVPPKPE
jgi:hypothetical protein